MPTNRFDQVEREKIVELAQKTLWSDEGRAGRDYLLIKRKIKEDTIKKFFLGYVPEETKHQLAGRVIFPVYDASDNLVAINSREIKSGSSLPKYWHEQYNKSFYLYGMNLAKKRIRETGFCLVCEGNVDVIKCHDGGFTNVVGLSGTSISDFQVATLLRYCEKVIFCFDNDDNLAGEKAAERTLFKLKAYEFPMGNVSIINVGLVKLIDGKDPDDFICKFGIVPFKKLVKKELDRISR